MNSTSLGPGPSNTTASSPGFSPDVAIGSGEPWAPYMELVELIDRVLSHPSGEDIEILRSMIADRQGNLRTLTTCRPKNATEREQLKKSVTDPTTFHGQDKPQTLPLQIVNEALLVSDILDISEFYALDLLVTGELEAGSFPSWSRGLTAIYMYYEGWFSLLSAVNSLICVTPGLTWGSRGSPKLLGVCKPFFEGLVRSNVIDKAIDLLGKFDIRAQTELLDSSLALGDWRHRTEVANYFVRIRVELARIVFGIQAQERIGWKDTLRILEYLRSRIVWKTESKQGRMCKDDSILVAAVLYALDNNLNGEEYDKQFALELKKYITEAESVKSFQCPELLELLKLGYHTVVYRIIADTTVNLSGGIINHRGISGVQAAQDLLGDEDLEFTTNVFAFLGSEFLGCDESLKEEEHVMRRVHNLFTDFINHIPMKLKELKSRAEESARTAAWYLEQGLARPANLSMEYETFLNTMGMFYCMDTDYKLGEDYFNTDPQHVALTKFIRSLCSDSPSMFVCNAHVLVGLAVSYPTGVFGIVRQSGHNMSLDHFFESIIKHLTTFGTRITSFPPHFSSETYQRVIMDPLKAGLKPQEVHGIMALLHLIQNLCVDNCIKLYFIETKKQWLELIIAIGKIRALPRELRTEMFKTVAAMIPEKIASQEAMACLWDVFTNSKLVESCSGDLRDELEEKETRLESYMLTIGFLNFFNALVKASRGYALDDTLFAEIRGNKAVLDPYVYYIRDAVLLKLPYRTYKDPKERWEMLSTSLSIITHLLDDVPHLMIQLVSDSPLVRMIFSFLVDCTKVREMSTGPIPQVDNCSYEILKLIYEVTLRQDKYLLRKEGHLKNLHDSVLIGIHDLILTINPESGKAEYLLSIIKFIDKYNPAKHRELSLELLTAIISGHGEIDIHLYSVVTGDPALADVLRNTFCESLADRKSSPPVKRNILQLLRSSIVHASPNFGMFLLGVDKKIEFDNLSPTGKWTSILHPLLGNIASLPDVFLTLLVLIKDARLREPLLRYLRSIQFFVKFYRDEFPSPGMDLVATGHFLKCISMELKFSQTVGPLAHVLVVQDSNKFLNILGNLDLHCDRVDFPSVDYFEPAHVNEALRECEYVDKEYKVRVIDIKKLEAMFDEEIAKLEKNTALRLRKSVAAEAKDLIGYATTLNEIRKVEASKLRLFHCWKQSLEVLILTPGTLKLAGIDFVTSTLRLVMDKISEIDSASEPFRRLTGETVLSLCGVLEKFAGEFSETLLNLILSSLCNLAANEETPRVRALLYPSVLSVLRIINQQEKTITSSTMIGVLLDGLCKDCLNSGDVGKITAMVLLGEIIFWSTRTGLGGLASRKGTPLVFGPSPVQTSSEASFNLNKSEYVEQLSYHQVGPFGDVSSLPREQKNGLSVPKSPFVGDGSSGDFHSTSYTGMAKSKDMSYMNKSAMKRRIGDILSRTESMEDDNSSVFSVRSSAFFNTYPAQSILTNILHSRGLLRNIIEDLIHTDDKDLIDLFSSAPGSHQTRALFVFETKMHLLCRFAQSGPHATQELLDNNLILKLSDMRVFRMLSSFESRDPLVSQGLLENEMSSDPVIRQEASTEPLSIESVFVAVLNLFHSLDLKGGRHTHVGAQVWHFINVNERSFETLISSYPKDPYGLAKPSLNLLTSLLAKIGQHVPKSAIDPKSNLMAKITYCMKLQAGVNTLSNAQTCLIRDFFHFIYAYCTNTEALDELKYNGKNTPCRILFSPRMDYAYRNLGVDEELTVGTILKLVEITSSRIPNWDGDKIVRSNLISIMEIGLLLAYWHTEEYLRNSSKSMVSEQIQGYKTYQQLLATQLEESLVKCASDAAECTSSKEFIIGILIRLRRLAHLEI